MPRPLLTLSEKSSHIMGSSFTGDRMCAYSMFAVVCQRRRERLMKNFELGMTQEDISSLLIIDCIFLSFTFPNQMTSIIQFEYVLNFSLKNMNYISIC